MARILFFLSAWSCLRAFAAFRVYQLLVTQYDAKGKAVRHEVVLTNLDAEQWGSYHGTDERLRIVMQDTWYCPGDTHGRAYCPKPKLAPRVPASLQQPTRIELPYDRQPVIP